MNIRSLFHVSLGLCAVLSFFSCTEKKSGLSGHWMIDARRTFTTGFSADYLSFASELSGNQFQVEFSGDSLATFFVGDTLRKKITVIDSVLYISEGVDNNTSLPTPRYKIVCVTSDTLILKYKPSTTELKSVNLSEVIGAQQVFVASLRKSTAGNDTVVDHSIIVAFNDNIASAQSLSNYFTPMPPISDPLQLTELERNFQKAFSLAKINGERAVKDLGRHQLVFFRISH